MISFRKFSCLFPILLFSAMPAFSQDSPDKNTQFLYFTTWEGSFLSMHRQGVACWVVDDEGHLRSEIMLGGQEPYPDNLKRVMDWGGAQGWTVVSVDSGGGTYSRWNEQWQELAPAWDTWLRVLISQTSGGIPLPGEIRDVSPGGRPLLLPLYEKNSHQPRVKRLQMPMLGAQTDINGKSDSGFRQSMTRRGRGRGGKDSILSLVAASTDNSVIRITSSHMPVTLHLSNPLPVAAQYSPEEVFLPWWPLSSAVHLKK